MIIQDIGVGLIAGIIYGIARAYLPQRWLTAAWLVLVGTTFTTIDSISSLAPGWDFVPVFVVFSTSEILTEREFKKGRKK